MYRGTFQAYVFPTCVHGTVTLLLVMLGKGRKHRLIMFKF